MSRNITLKVWANKDTLIHDKRIEIVDEYVTDTKIRIPFDEYVFQAIQDGNLYELMLDNTLTLTTKVYKEGKWMAIDYIGGR